MATALPTLYLARHGETDDRRALFQQTLHVGCWHMPFEHVAAYQRCVARPRALRHAVCGLERVQFLRLGDLGGEAGGLQMFHPLRTASAGRVLVDIHER